MRMLMPVLIPGPMNDRQENIVRINGKRSIGLSVYKEMRFNTVKVVDGVIRRLAVIEQALPGYRFQVITNQGTFIKNHRPPEPGQDIRPAAEHAGKELQGVRRAAAPAGRRRSGHRPRVRLSRSLPPSKKRPPAMASTY